MATMIETRNLTKDYGGGRGVRDLTLSVPAGSIFGFIGPNGSGKSTTIKILCGLVNADGGEARVNGLDVKPANHMQIKKIVGYLPDEFGVYEQMTVWEYLDFFGAAYKIPPAERAKRIEAVLDITDARHMIDYMVSSLSRGMHQKIGIAKTMLHDPALLILDEPANGLDPHARIEMRKTILRLKELGKTLLISSHILPELGSICDLVGIIENGQLLTFGTMKEITRSLKQDLVFEIQVDSDMKLAAKLCEGFDGVVSVTYGGQELRLIFRGQRNRAADLNRHLTENGVRVVSLKESEVDLENVFLSVTGRKDPTATTVPRRQDSEVVSSPAAPAPPAATPAPAPAASRPAEGVVIEAPRIDPVVLTPKAAAPAAPAAAADDEDEEVDAETAAYRARLRAKGKSHRDLE